MDLLEFTDKINGLSAKMRDLKEHITTEENTKASFVTPFSAHSPYVAPVPKFDIIRHMQTNL